MKEPSSFYEHTLLYVNAGSVLLWIAEFEFDLVEVMKQTVLFLYGVGAGMIRCTQTRRTFSY